MKDRGQEEKSTSASAERVIHVIGPRSLQNDLLAFFLEQRTGAKCLTGVDFSHVEGQDEVDPQNPPLVLLDAHGKDLESILIEIESGGRQLLSQAYVALINVDPGSRIEEEAVLRGIRGFFYESDPPEPLLKGVNAIFDGEFWVSRSIMSKCIGKQRSHDTVGVNATIQLTARETEILAMVAVGIKNEEIADKLCISPHTVKTHIYNIFKKIDVPNRLQAALWAARHL